MKWWPLTFKNSLSADEGKELAKRQLDETKSQREVADALVDSSIEAAHEARFFLYANHFGPNTAKALQEGRKP